MATLSIPKDYSAGEVLQKSHLDSIESAIETFLNVTQIGYENIDIETTFQGLSQAQADTILTTGGYGSLTTTTLAADTSLSTVTQNINTTSTFPAGKYLIVANALVLTRATTISLDANISANVFVDLYNITSNTQITPSAIVKTGNVGLRSNTTLYTLVESVLTMNWIYPITLTSSAGFGFKAYNDIGSAGVGYILQNSTIQVYRLRS